MDHTKNRKFKVYNALQLALRKGQVPNHGSTATLLLECFIEDSGRLQASKAVSRSVCQEGKFSSWRDEMIKEGWLVWSQNQSDKGQYFAGKKLIPYLNKEKLATKEIATRDEIITRDEVPSKQEFDALRDKVEKIEASMKEIYENLELGEPDPPLYKKLKEKSGKTLPN